MEVKMKTLILFLIMLISISAFSQEKQFQKAHQKNTIKAYNKFIKKYPKSSFTDTAAYNMALLIDRRSALRDFIELYPNSGLPEDASYKLAMKSSSFKYWELYLEKYPYGKYKDLAQENYYNRLITSNDLIDCEKFTELLSNSKYSIEDLQFRKAQLLNTISDWEYFIKSVASDSLKHKAEIAIQQLTFHCTIESIFTGTIEIRDDLVIKYNNGYDKEYKQSFRNIRELNIEWDYEIKKEYLNPVWMSTTKNGKTKESFTYDKVKEIYGFRIKSVSVKTFDNQTTKLTNIESIYPDNLVFNTNVDEKQITISLILKEFEKSMDSFSTEADVNRFFMSKPISLDKTNWEAPISDIKFFESTNNR